MSFLTKKTNEEELELDPESVDEGAVENLTYAIERTVMQQNGVTANVRKISKDLHSLTEALELHARLARMRYSHDLGDHDGVFKGFLLKLEKLAKLKGKTNEEVARTSKRLISALDRHRKQELVEEILLEVETLGMKRIS